MTKRIPRLEQFRDAIDAIESRRAKWLMDLQAREPDAFAQFAAALSADASDPVARDRLIETLAETLRPAVEEDERTRIRLLVELAPLYEYLVSASPEEWSAYIDLVLAARGRSVIATSEWLRRSGPQPTH